MKQKYRVKYFSLRFYAESKFCICFEVHIPVMLMKLDWNKPEKCLID